MSELFVEYASAIIIAIFGVVMISIGIIARSEEASKKSEGK